MEKVYLDTMIYNDIIDKKISNGDLDILKRAIGKEIEIIFSDLLLTELASTLESTIKNESERYDRTKVLFRCALGIISGKIVKNPDLLIQEEIEAFIKKRKKPSIFFNEEQTKNFIDVIKKLAQGKKNYNKEVLNRVRLCKKKGFESQKKIFSKNILKNTYSKNSNSNFEQFCTANFKTYEEEVVNDLLSRIGINGNITEKVKEIRNNLECLPHLKALLRIIPALCFSAVKENRKPGLGDKYDLYHMTCASTLDAFISNELGILNIFRWTYNDKKCMNLHDFIKYLSNIMNVQIVN